MKVMKFGGTALSTVERIKKAAAYLLSKNYEGAVETLCALEEKYLSATISARMPLPSSSVSENNDYYCYI